METYIISQPIRVFCVTATSFPAGIGEAWKLLGEKVPGSQNRKHYGISQGSENGTIIYKAAVEEAVPGEPLPAGCETFIIANGNYLSKTIKNWRADETIIGKTFQQMIIHPQLDRAGYCVEIYLNEQDVICLAKLADEH